jgi:polyhydroxyalkanoate synthase subunit PhaC
MNDHPPLTDAGKTFDPEAFSKNLARVLENASKALSAYLKPRESGEMRDQTAEDLAQVVKTFHAVANYWLADPSRASELQTRLGKAYLNLWENAARRLAGEEAPPTIEALQGPRVEFEPVL